MQGKYKASVSIHDTTHQWHFQEVILRKGPTLVLTNSNTSLYSRRKEQLALISAIAAKAAGTIVSERKSGLVAGTKPCVCVCVCSCVCVRACVGVVDTSLYGKQADTLNRVGFNSNKQQTLEYMHAI